MEAKIEIAGIEDYEETLDFINYVFSYSSMPHDFKIILPKLYKREYFTDQIHYLIKEQGKIKAAVCACPLSIEIGNISLPGRGIGMVSVHPYSRSRGYMNILMAKAMEDMKRDGMVFSCLDGQRQRYEYFGFTPAGMKYVFNCEKANITHTLGKHFETNLSLEKVNADDTELLDQIYAMHETKNARLYRNRNRLFDILSTWDTETVAIMDKSVAGLPERFRGYYVNKTGDRRAYISEINMKDFSQLKEVTALVFRRQKETGLAESAAINASVHELEKFSALSAFAESCSMSNAYKFAVFNHARLADAFIKLKAGCGKIREGSFVLEINYNGTVKKIRLFAGRDTGAEETDESPELSLTGLEATRFLFSSQEAVANPVIKNSEFLQSVLPLPLFYETPDGV